MWRLWVTMACHGITPSVSVTSQQENDDPILGLSDWWNHKPKNRVTEWFWVGDWYVCHHDKWLVLALVYSFGQQAQYCPSCFSKVVAAVHSNLCQQEEEAGLARNSMLCSHPLTLAMNLLDRFMDKPESIPQAASSDLVSNQVHTPKAEQCLASGCQRLAEACLHCQGWECRQLES